MKKRMLSLFVTTALVLGLAVTMAFAADDGTGTAVAVVGEQTYNTLKEAVEAANGQTITLVDDAAITEKLTINEDVTILGGNHAIVGQADDKNAYIEVVGGTFMVSDVTLKDFGGNVSGASGNAVIKVPATAAADTVVNATNVSVSNFSRSAYDIRSGSFAITGGTIDCANQVTGESNSKLTKGVLAGLGSNKVTGTITGVTVTMSDSNYADWNTAAIEVYNNADVRIDSCTIENVQNGIHVDNYYGSAGQDVSVTVSNTTATATDAALKLYSTYNGNGGAANAKLTVTGGTYTGDVRIVGATDKDALALTGGTYVVSDESQLKNVLTYAAAQQGEQVNVQLAGDIALSSMLNLTQSNVSIDLAGNTITASDSFAGSYENDKHLVTVYGENVTLKNGTLQTTQANKHVLNVYGATNFTLENAVLDHTQASKGAPLVVNGSTMTVSGKVEMITGAASWYAMNVDNKVDNTATACTVTFAKDSQVAFSGTNPLGIYLETTNAGTQVAVNFQENVTVASNVKDFVAVAVADGANAAKVENPENAGLDTDENGNLVIHNHNFGTAWVSDGTSHWHECDCGEKQDVAQHTFQWVVDKEATATEKGSKHEECTVCGYAKAAVEIPATGTTEPSQQPSAQPTQQPSAQPSQKPDGDKPQTGDSMNLTIWVALMVICLGTLTSVSVYTKKRG